MTTIQKLKKYRINDGTLIVELRRLKPDLLYVVDLPESETIGMFNHKNNCAVYQFTCPHMGGDLEVGDFCPNNKTITCPWHGYTYDLVDGRFISNPNENIFRNLKPTIGAPSYHNKENFFARLASVPALVDNELLVIDLKKYASKL